MTEQQIKEANPGMVFPVKVFNDAFANNVIWVFYNSKYKPREKGFVLKTNQNGYRYFNRKCEANHYWATTPSLHKKQIERYEKV